MKIFVLLFLILTQVAAFATENPKTSDKKFYQLGQNIPITVEKNNSRINFRFIAWKGYYYSIWMWNERWGEWELRFKNVTTPDVDRWKSYYIPYKTDRWAGRTIIIKIRLDQIRN